MKKRLLLLGIIAIGLSSCVSYKDHLITEAPYGYFVNPVKEMGADPFVTYRDGMYYYVESNGHLSVFIKSAENLIDVFSAKSKEVWKWPKDSGIIAHTWAPEMHYLDGKWYIYVASSTDPTIQSHNMYVLESKTQNPMDGFILKGQIADQYDAYGIDGSVLELPNGDRYYVWSGWEGREKSDQYLYIMEMTSPWETTGERVMISAPTLEWERPNDHPPVNEGPQALVKNDAVHILYSGNTYWHEEYSFGMLSLQDGADPMLKDSWLKQTEPVFSKWNYVLGVGHGITIEDENGMHWIIYHSLKPEAGRGIREIHMQPFIFNKEDHPVFGVPVGRNVLQIRPE